MAITLETKANKGRELVVDTHAGISFMPKSVILERLQMFEAVMEDVHGIIIRQDRSITLDENNKNRTSCVLAKRDFSYRPRPVDGEDGPLSQVVFDDSSSVGVFPILQGIYSASQALGYEEYSDQARWVIGREAAETVLCIKCINIMEISDDITGVTNQRRAVLELFNSCIDIGEATGVDFIGSNEMIKNTVEMHADFICDSLIEQLMQQIIDYIKPEEANPKTRIKSPKKRVLPNIPKYLYALTRACLNERDTALSIKDFVESYQDWVAKQPGFNNASTIINGKKIIDCLPD